MNSITKNHDHGRHASKERVVRTKVLPANKIPKPTEAFQILQRSLRFISLFGVLLGYDMKYDWQRNRRFVFMEYLLLFTWSQMLYTQFLYIYQHTTVRIWEIFALYGIAFSAVLKLRCYEKYFKNMTALFNSTLNICKQCAGDQAEKLKSQLHDNFLYYKFLTSLAIGVTVMYMYYPLKSYVIDGELVSFEPFEIMFIDQSTMSGYVVANSIMVLAGISSVLGTGYMTLNFVALIMNYGIRVDILKANFNELDEMWSENKSMASSVAYRHLFLRNICRKTIDMRLYIKEVKKVFDQKMFLFFAFAYLSQILCLYQIRVNNWVQGYSLAIGFFLEMIFYCVMGTKLTLENERLCYIITQSKWYTYDIRSQKLILILLNLAMNSEELWIGPLKPLSVFTATEIIKSIYTYYTVMIEIL